MNETDCALRTRAQSSELRQHATSKACRGAVVAACTVTISYYWSIRKQRFARYTVPFVPADSAAPVSRG